MIHKFPGETLLRVIEITQNLYKKEFNRIKAAALLLSLADAAEDKLDKRLLVSAAQLVQFLPMNFTYSDILEGKLITRYIMYAMQPLFDDDERGIQLDFTFDEQVDTCSREISFTGCPNCIITQFRHQTDDDVKVGFGEVKREAVAKDHYLINLDLLRLGTLGKNSADSNNLTGNLSLHIVGHHITFYLIQLNADGLYSMTELARIKYPMTVSEVPAYVTNFNDQVIISPFT